MEKHFKNIQQFLVKNKKNITDFFTQKLFQISITVYAWEVIKDDLKITALENKYFIYVCTHTQNGKNASIYKWVLESLLSAL